MNNIAVVEGIPGQWMINNSVKNIVFNYVRNIMDPNNQRGHFNGYFKNRGRNYIAVNQNGQIIGFAILRQNKNGVADITLIGTRPGRGIGRKIMTQIYNNAKARGLSQIRVIDPVNNAKNFYRKLNFKNAKLNKENVMTRNIVGSKRKRAVKKKSFISI